MKQIKGMIKANLANSPFDIIYWGNPCIKTFQEALLSYQSSSMSGKAEIQQRAYRKLSKSKPPQIVLGTLHILDLIIHQGYSVSIPNGQSMIDFETG